MFGLGKIIAILTDFVNTLLPGTLSVPIMLLVGVVLGLAAWRVVT